MYLNIDSERQNRHEWAWQVQEVAVSIDELTVGGTLFANSLMYLGGVSIRRSRNTQGRMLFAVLMIFFVLLLVLMTEVDVIVLEAFRIAYGSLNLQQQTDYDFLASRRTSTA